jgi:hypothetical protein
MTFSLDKKAQKNLLIALIVGVSAPLLADAIKKQIKKKEDSKKPKTDANTDHSFSSWTGDENFLESKYDHFVNQSAKTQLVPLSSRERLKNYPVYKKYTPFDVSPTKKLKIS